ncbi:DMT family transporter [Rhizobium sp. BK251]|uniref:DMT family transporter n=1 Tax=Rhizobium sp. BK251 TaxID=2512125 RepID=UPI0010508325|nr:DMT family transporter [Rhizobium sp. BK251]TCL70287.1 putative membrane protein [Rhizobium sp. BK251]
MPFPALSPHRKGLLLTTIGGLALSMDILLIRLAHGDVWSILGVRSIATLLVTVVIVAAMNRFARTRPVLFPGWQGVVVGCLYALSTLTFLIAVYNTAAANVVFILAFNPMFAVLLSWIFLKERPSPSTLLTILAMVFGVSLIVRDGLSSGHLFGDLMALLSALIIAAAITIGRASRRDMGFASLLSTVAPVAVGFCQVLPAGLSIEHPAWIVLDGAVMMPVAFWCLATGTRFLSAPEVGMFYLLETILAPIWVWLIFLEAPSTMTLVGGTILIAALSAHSLWQVRANTLRQPVLD